ncbi:Putative periplasmic protein [Salmonella enterica subsp. enterica serovar Mississippi str. A4-633]|nr:Putative periplasmic protein [Salmonella enterica subsp. enterica serovar Mississippi str. A4-633]
MQVKGENGNLVITPDGNVMYNGKQYTLSAAQRAARAGERLPRRAARAGERLPGGTAKRAAVD